MICFNLTTLRWCHSVQRKGKKSKNTGKQMMSWLHNDAIIIQDASFKPLLLLGHWWWCRPKCWDFQLSTSLLPHVICFHHEYLWISQPEEEEEYHLSVVQLNFLISLISTFSNFNKSLFSLVIVLWLTHSETHCLWSNHWCYYSW